MATGLYPNVSAATPNNGFFGNVGTDLTNAASQFTDAVFPNWSAQQLNTQSSNGLTSAVYVPTPSYTNYAYQPGQVPQPAAQPTLFDTTYTGPVNQNSGLVIVALIAIAIAVVWMAS